MYNFLAWVAAQGIKHIPKRWLIQAFNSFKKLPGNQVILKKAKNLWDDAIKKTPTKDIADKVRDKLIIPKQYNKFTPTIVPKIKIVPKKPNPLGDALKTGKYKKVPTPKKLTPKTETDKVLEEIGIKDKIFIDKGTLKGPRKFDFGSKVIYGKFPKKPPGKADGGSIDKALPKRSRDI